MNVKLGKYNQLEVVKEVDFGVYLDGGDDGEILLPTRYVPEGCKPGDVLNVFLYAALGRTGKPEKFLRCGTVPRTDGPLHLRPVWLRRG